MENRKNTNTALAILINTLIFWVVWKYGPNVLVWPFYLMVCVIVVVALRTTNTPMWVSSAKQVLKVPLYFAIGLVCICLLYFLLIGLVNLRS